jgi:hypothetical protein
MHGVSNRSRTSCASKGQRYALPCYALLASCGCMALGDPHARPISDKLWELRAGAGRIFYVALTGRRFTLLHAYIKKSRKAPEREIETARRRLADLLEREKQ